MIPDEEEGKAENPKRGRKKAAAVSKKRSRENGAQETENKKKPRNIALQKQIEDDSEFIPRPGSIKDLELTNFLSYSHFKFFFGKRLNVILGPNGFA